MTQPTQSYANHARWYPLYHFVVTPILVANTVVMFRRLWANPTSGQAWEAVVAVGLLLLGWTARAMALTVQNRVIRLEMRLRLREVLPTDLYAKIDGLRVGQLVALRFASDAELPSLVQRCLANELVSGKSIKQAITHWQPDFLRA